MITAVEAKTKAEHYLGKLRETVIASDEMKMADRFIADNAAKGGERVVIEIHTLDPDRYCKPDFWRLMVQEFQKRGFFCDNAGGCITIDWSEADPEEAPKAPNTSIELKGWGHD